MKVTFIRRSLHLTCDCELMSKAENRILTTMHFKTYDMTIPDMYQEVLEGTCEEGGIERILVNDNDDGFEFSILTCKVEKYENYAIIRINCNPLT